MWNHPQKMRFGHENLIYVPAPSGCEYGAFRAPPLPFPPLPGELPEMTDTAGLIVTTNGPITTNHHNHHLNNNNAQNAISTSPGSSSSSGSSPNNMVVAADGTTTTATSTILTVRMIMQGKVS
jgi:hypothetical protein